MRTFAIVGTLLFASGCTHIPMQGAEVRHAELLRPPAGGMQPDAVSAAAAPGEWTVAQCDANSVVQDVWGGLAIGGATLAGASGFSSFEFQTDGARNAARYAAVVAGAVGIVAELISNNVKTRGAEYCPLAKPRLDTP
jgi:hypothetical protein